jgi:hypothetical protein
VRVAGRLFAAIAAFFGLVGAVYWFVAREPAGTAALIFTGALGFLVAFYFLFTAERVEPLPEDEEDAVVEDYAGEYGFFSPHSWWPLPVGLGAGMTALGLAFVLWWLILAGGVVVLGGTIGLLFEYYAGEFARE